MTNLCPEVKPIKDRWFRFVQFVKEAAYVPFIINIIIKS